MRVFAPPGGGGELGRAGEIGGEDYALMWHVERKCTITVTFWK